MTRKWDPAALIVLVGALWVLAITPDNPKARNQPELEASAARFSN
jgi:hypothetical protein